MVEQSDTAKLTKVAQSLLVLTATGRIKWEKDPRSEDSYAYSTTDTTIVIRSQDVDGEFPYVMSVRDRDGDTVATITVAASFSDVAQKNLFLELYKSARRSALQVDEVLDRLIDVLETDEQPEH